MTLGQFLIGFWCGLCAGVGIVGFMEGLKND